MQDGVQKNHRKVPDFKAVPLDTDPLNGISS